MTFRILFSIAVLSTATASFAAERSPVPTAADILARAHQAKRACEKRCLTGENECLSACMADEEERTTNFFLSAFTAHCAGEPFEAKLAANPTLRRLALEQLQAAQASLRLARSPELEKCIGSLNGELARSLLEAGRLADSKRSESEETN